MSGTAGNGRKTTVRPRFSRAPVRARRRFFTPKGKEFRPPQNDGHYACMNGKRAYASNAIRMDDSRTPMVPASCPTEEISRTLRRLRPGGNTLRDAIRRLASRIPYSRGMLCSRQRRIISSGQMLLWISPMCAFCNSSMHRRLWPIPPPMVRGNSPAISFLWKESSRRAS